MESIINTNGDFIFSDFRRSDSKHQTSSFKIMINIDISDLKVKISDDCHK